MLDLIWLISWFQVHALLLFHTFDADSIELSVVHDLSFHTLMIKELKKLLPGDFVFVFVIKFFDESGD